MGVGRVWRNRSDRDGDRFPESLIYQVGTGNDQGHDRASALGKLIGQWKFGHTREEQKPATTQI